MSAADRDKWDERYRRGAYADREHPSEWLRRWLPDLPRGRALDIACGAGRNAIHLAENGFSVVGVDISSVALGRAAASARRLEIEWLERDLDAGLDLDAVFDLILMIRYLDLGLMSSLVGSLAPGGYLVVEEHLETDADVIGPRNPAFRVPPGALRDAAGDLEVIDYREGIVTDPDGRSAALARLVACRAG